MSNGRVSLRAIMVGGHFTLFEEMDVDVMQFVDGIQYTTWVVVFVGMLHMRYCSSFERLHYSGT